MDERVKRKAVRKQILNHTSSVSCHTTASHFTQQPHKQSRRTAGNQALNKQLCHDSAISLCFTGLPETGLQRETPLPLLDCKGKDFLQGWFRGVCFMWDMSLALKTTSIRKRPSNNLYETPVLVKAYCKPIFNIKSVSLNVRLLSFQFFTELISVKTGHGCLSSYPTFLLEHKCFLIRRNVFSFFSTP